MRFLPTVLILAATTVSAQANCYEDIGCPDRDVFSRSDLRRMSCENLWYVRNQIYNEHGYCFKTRAAKQAFDNSDCSVRNAARLDLNRKEVTNISRIRQVERQKGCTGE